MRKHLNAIKNVPQTGRGIAKLETRDARDKRLSKVIESRKGGAEAAAGAAAKAGLNSTCN